MTNDNGTENDNDNVNDNDTENDNGIHICIGEITIEESAPNKFKYNNIHITSIYKYDLPFYQISISGNFKYEYIEIESEDGDK